MSYVVRGALTVGLICLFVAEPAPADTLRYAFDQSTYVVEPGETVLVNVYLQETSTHPWGALLGDGLLSGGVQIRFDTPLPLDPARVRNPADIHLNPAFDNSTATATLLNGGVAGAAGAVRAGSPAVLPTRLDDRNLRVWLGSFAFTAGNLDGQMTQLRAVDFSATTLNTRAAQGVVLDGLIASDTASILTAAASSGSAPEPGTLSLLTLGLLGAAGYRWRKGRQLAA